ncbi:WASH complex subunit 2C [Rana temporaria]|uniref:WASH complex subunit 2C n=1 Tax=Rana temporaria TaxID=8407 RepID=UPI001AACA94C|nr:WASH complex subunit 2C [Rana temporaria]
MNGPVSCTGEEAVWERPWSLEEIRRSSHSWSLGADAGLLNFLKEFSQQTISRTHEIEKQLDGLVREVKATDCRLHNVFNDFLMLSNTQFIENRVYDEEVEEHIVKPEQGEKHEQERTREQKEAELIPKIQEAVNYGLQVLETAFEQLDIKAGNSDSEDEEVNERVDLILEPKDLYIDRPLPYLIGSQSFMQQEDVGLGDLSSEEGSVDIDRGSVLDSEEEEEEEEEEEKDNEEESDEDFGNNSEEEKKLRTALSDEDEDNGSDLFGESDKEDEEEHDKSAKTRTKSFADELAARIQAEIPKRLEADESSISSSEVKTKKEKEKKEVRNLPSDDEDDYMFKPPKLTDEDFFGNKGGLFSGGKGLFDDDEEGDLFSDLQTKESKPTEPAPVAKPETLPSDVKKKPPYGGVSLFPGGENVINPSILVDKDKRKAATPTEVAPKPVTTNTSLFDDDVMFGSAPAQPTAKAKPAADLFAEDDDLFNDRPSMPPGTVAKNKVAADLDKKNIQMPAEKPQPPEPINKRLAKGLFSDEDDSESDLFSPSQTGSKPKAATSAAPASKTSKALSLFDDEDEDLFGAAPESKPMPATTKPTQQPVLPTASKTQKSTLFTSVEEEPIKVPNDTKPVEKNKTDLSVPPKPKKEEKTSSLFEKDDLFGITKDSQKKHQRVSLLFEEDENSEEPLFSSAGSSTKSTGQTLEQSKTTVKVDAEKVSLFDDVHKNPDSKAPVPAFEDTVPPAAQKNNAVKSVSVKESDDLFADTPPTQPKPKSTNVLSLFGEEDEEYDEDMEDQLSTSASSKDSERASTEKSTQAKSTRVFQDEELLFSQELQKDNDPDVDLFASNSKKSVSFFVFFDLVTFVEIGSKMYFSFFVMYYMHFMLKWFKEKKTVIKKDSLDSSKEPSSLNIIKKETIVKAEGGEKPAVPPPVKSKSPSTRIGKLQANLHINPAALLPGAVPKQSGPKHTVPETDISGLPVAESSQSLDVSRKSVEGVTFETPAQVDTLHSANKSRAKVSGKRRPPTRMGRKHASQDSGGDVSDSSAISPTQDTLSEATLARSNWQLDKEGPIPGMKLSFSENDVQSRTKPKAPVNPLTPDVKDFFGSDLFGSSSLPDPVTSRQKENLPVNEALSQPREEVNKPSSSVFDGDGSDDDLFKSVKEKHKKTFKPTSLLDDDPADLFGAQKPEKKVEVQPVPPKNIKATADIFEDDIFAAEAIKPVKKPNEKKTASEANLFDNSDIFADLTHKPKEKKSKKKVEAKSIFDDDMDDIFSTSASSTKKSKPKAKSTPTSETKQDTKFSSMFDDPLNVFGK